MAFDNAAPTVSLCMIVRNEALTLPVCLASAAPVVDEIVVVDTGSTDATPVIATAAGAQVFYIPWANDFAAARNVSLDHASAEWILVLDADEELAPGSAANLRAVLTQTDVAALRVRVRNLLPASDLQSFEDSPGIRLFRNRPTYRYQHPIHEQIRPAIERAGGRVADSLVVILHHGYEQQDLGAGRARAERNLALLLLTLSSSPADPYTHFQLGVTYKALGQSGLAQRHLTTAWRLDHGVLSPEVRIRLLTRLAQLALGRNLYEEAVGWSELALAEQPQNVTAHYVAGVSSAYLGRSSEAGRHFYALRYQCPVDPREFADLDALLACFTTSEGYHRNGCQASTF